MKLIFTLVALFSLSLAQLNLLPERDGLNLFTTPSNLETRRAKPCSTGAINNNVNGAIVTHIKLNNTLESIPDDGPITKDQLGALSSELNTITNYLNAAIKAARCHKKLSKADCNKILHILTVNFQPIVFTVLDDIVNHLVAFQNAGVLSTICSDVDGACSLIQQLFSALEAIADPVCKRKLVALAAQFAQKCANTHAALGCP